ncbi:S1C family serine protease [Winogradskyella forsetii]|uniref:S1C family serine protease n=1 Tax=Winogradskyella forsetii TaxID=2686077 RepID=UPI0015BF5997|nr:serine protease [Winogradskyella forsetii]
MSLGSGFIVDSGKIIINLHVIEDAAFGYVTISGETEKHKLEGYLSVDKTNDLALLSVPTLTGNSIEINENKPEIGEKIYAIGNPKGLSGTISAGIISGIRNFDSEELIQITAPISPGSSGGPVINNEGKLIGVSVGTLNSGQNLNFAIPTKYVLKLIELPTTQITKLNMKSVAKKNSQSNLGKNIKEGLEIINIEWEREIFTDPYPKNLQGFSIKNNLPYEINKVKLLFILRNAQGQPIDAFEYNALSYDFIKPFLAKFVETGPFNDIGRRRVGKIKKGEKLEIRILDFTIKE